METDDARGAIVSEKRRGLGRGLGALIPSAPVKAGGGDRPVDDVFFRDNSDGAKSSAESSTIRPASAP